MPYSSRHAQTVSPDFVDPAAQWNDLSPSAASCFEVPGGATTLVVVDMQQIFLDGWKGPSQPPIEAVIRQVKQAMKMGWAIVLLENKPWRVGRTIPAILEVLDGQDGKYPRYAHCSKQTTSGAKELIEACCRHGFGMGLFRFTGVYLPDCVLATARGVHDMEPASLVRLMKEACSTDIDVPGAWDDVWQEIRSNLRITISSEEI